MEKMYWKCRKEMLNIIFKIKAFLHKKREVIEKKKDDLSFEKSVTWEVIKTSLKNVFCIVIIILIERKILTLELFSCLPESVRNFQRWLFAKNAGIMEDKGVLVEILSALIGVVGVFLGLYCSNVMSMFAEKYANAPQKISRLFENDIVTNKCIKAITDYLIFSIIVLLLLVVQVDIGIVMLFICGIKGLKIVVSFGFMSRRTFQFSDMYYVTNSVYRDLYKVMQHLNKGNLFVKDKNFQNHYKKQVIGLLEILSDVNSYNLDKEEKISVSVEEFMKNNVILLYTYWEEKVKIPYDSYWYDEKIVYKKWYSASDTEINMALRTGTLLGHTVEKNYLWFEEKIESINSEGLKYLITKKSFTGVLRWLGTVCKLAERAVISGNISYYVEYINRLQKTFQDTLGKGKISLEEEMALSEQIIICYLNVLIEARKYIEKHNANNVLYEIRLLEKKGWNNKNKYCNFPDVKKMCDGIRAEIKIEGKRITPLWYVNQIVVKHYYDELLTLYKAIDKEVNQYLPGLASYLLEQKKYAGAMVVFSKYSEIKSKLYLVEDVLCKHIEWVCSMHKEKTIVWEEKPEFDIAKRFDMLYKKMSAEWYKCTGEFIMQNWEKYNEYPDILGACTTYLCEILIDAITDNDFETFSLNYKILLGSLLLYQEYSRGELLQIKEVYRQRAVLAVYSNPIIEYSLISGYAYIWGEISGDSRWKELVFNDTKEKIVEKNLTKGICQILKGIRQRGPAIYNRDVLHTNWKQRVESFFKKNENLQWKRTMFSEVYNGDSKLLKVVLSEKDGYELLNYEAFEIYAIVVLNQFVSKEEQYHSEYNWEEEYYEQE